jgi:hypothetical protein
MFSLDKVKTRLPERGGPVKVSNPEHALDNVLIKALSAAYLTVSLELCEMVLRRHDQHDLRMTVHCFSQDERNCARVNVR